MSLNLAQGKAEFFVFLQQIGCAFSFLMFPLFLSQPSHSFPVSLCQTKKLRGDIEGMMKSRWYKEKNDQTKVLAEDDAMEQHCQTLANRQKQPNSHLWEHPMVSAGVDL